MQGAFCQCHCSPLTFYCTFQALNKAVLIKRSLFIDVLELIQTEMHHVRTLKILLYVYGHELKQSSLIEETRLEGLFLVVEELLNCHQHFLDCLKLLKHQSHEEGSPHNYQITQLGNALIPQVGSVCCVSLSRKLISKVLKLCGGWDPSWGRMFARSSSSDSAGAHKQTYLCVRLVARTPVIMVEETPGMKNNKRITLWNNNNFFFD